MLQACNAGTTPIATRRADGSSAQRLHRPARPFAGQGCHKAHWVDWVV